jgi:hypothetical protein
MVEGAKAGRSGTTCRPTSLRTHTLAIRFQAEAAHQRHRCRVPYPAGLRHPSADEHIDEA